MIDNSIRELAVGDRSEETPENTSNLLVTCCTDDGRTLSNAKRLIMN